MSPKAHEWRVRLASWGVGGVFVYAGALKVADPLAFADSVASFQVLPAALISPVALVLPVWEILLGLALIAGVRRRVCAAVVGFFCAVFALALAQALARGLRVDCGCFGAGAPSAAKTVWALVRDLVLAFLAWRIATFEARHAGATKPAKSGRPARAL
jgi:putative oxidoreductase